MDAHRSPSREVEAIRARRARCGRRAFARVFLLFVHAAVVGATPAHAAKEDVVILWNGDRITGDVKGLSRGKLDYNTDDTGRLSIEWEKVARLTSVHVFDVEMRSGATYFGRIVPSNLGRYIVVQNEARSDTLRISDVVELSSLDAGFLQRSKAYLDVGFTLAKAHQATTFSLGGAFDYRGPRLGSELKFDSYAQGQEEVSTTLRNSVRQTVSWFLEDRWSAVGLGQFEQNDELGLDHRFSAGLAMNRTLKHTNQSEVSAGGGLVATQEEYSSETGGTTGTNLDGLASLNWDAFRFDYPKLDFATSLAVFPSLSDFGRVRGQLDLRLKYEVFRDFNAGINFTDVFDSRPLDETVSKNDFITTLTIGWSYRR
jgi:hypothetical protein